MGKLLTQGIRAIVGYNGVRGMANNRQTKVISVVEGGMDPVCEWGLP